jgi:D-3-phosphoglycerate dehydrogenase
MPAPRNLRVLVSDDVSEVGLDRLRAAGLAVVNRPGISGEELLRLVPEFDALLVRSRTRVTRDVLRAGKRLRAVGRAGFGLAHIDVEAASALGIVVLHSPEGNSVTAAELTIGLLFALARHIPQADASMHGGRWEKRRFRGIELHGKCLGVLGMGRVGRAVVERAVALGMRVLVHDPQVPLAEIRAISAWPAGWDELLGTSDFVTVHVPAAAQTRGLIGDDAFDAMKDRVRLIVTTPGGVVDEAALVRALRSGKVAGAAIDVWEREPPAGNPLLEFPQVIATPHLLASTFEAQVRVATALAGQVIDLLVHGRADDAVNPEALAVARVME